MKVNVINHVKQFRNNVNLTQTELAKAVKVSRQSIISIEKGQYVPSLPLALKIAKHFNCSMDSLFQLNEEVKND